MIKSTKSANFDKKLNSHATINNQVYKNIYKMASLNLKTARDKYVPVATTQTKRSVRLNREPNGYSVESLSYKDVNGTGVDRYNYTKPNRTYTIKQGSRSFTVPAGKNAGKFKWFEKSHEEIKKLNIESEGIND